MKLMILPSHMCKDGAAVVSLSQKDFDELKAVLADRDESKYPSLIEMNDENFLTNLKNPK